MIKLSSIKRVYDRDVVALDNISLTINKGEYVAIVGESGSGKSTLLNIIGLVDSLFEGEYILNDVEVKNQSDKNLSILRNKNFGYVFQDFNLENNFTTFENVEIPLLLGDSNKKQYSERILAALKKVGLEDKIKTKVKKLSGGECQRTAIARALINDPSIIIADEPCGALDSKNALNIMNIFDDLNKEGKTIILVTHNENDAKKAKRIIRLKDGKIIFDEKV